MYLLPRRAFTLIELLTVIAIIGILAGILIPAVNRVRETARRSEAQTTVAEIETALNQYLAQYDRWPLMLSGTGELEVLVADPTSIFEGGTVRWTDGNESLFHSLTVIYAPDDFPFAPDQNRRRLILMTAGENRIFPSGANPETMVDPWGNEYSVAVDLTFSNRLDLSVIPSLELPLIRRNIAVWSYGGQPERTNRFIANFEVNP